MKVRQKLPFEVFSPVHSLFARSSFYQVSTGCGPDLRHSGSANSEPERSLINTQTRLGVRRHPPRHDMAAESRDMPSELR